MAVSKYLFPILIVFAISNNANAQLNLLKGNWESDSVNKLWIFDTAGHYNTVSLGINCDEQYDMQMINDTLFFRQSELTYQKQEITFEILLLNDSVLKIKVLRNTEYFSTDSFSSFTGKIIQFKRTERKLMGPIQFEKLRFSHGAVGVLGGNDVIEIDSPGILRLYKEWARKGRDNKPELYMVPQHLKRVFTKKDYENFLDLIDSVSLPSLHFVNRCIMDGGWADIVFKYNGHERVIEVAEDISSQSSGAQKLLHYLYSLAASMEHKHAKHN